VCPYKHNNDICIKEVFLPAAQLGILEKNFSVYLSLNDKLRKLKEELNVQSSSSNIAKCTKCAKYLVEFLVVLKCMHNYCLECLEDLKQQNNKNCIFNCLSKNKNNNVNNNSNKKFELNSEYFVKSLKENLALRAHLFSKKASVFISNNNNNNYGNLSQLKLLNEEENMQEKTKECFKSNKDAELNELDNSVISEEAKENAAIDAESSKGNFKEENVEDSYEIIN